MKTVNMFVIAMLVSLVAGCSDDRSLFEKVIGNDDGVSGCEFVAAVTYDAATTYKLYEETGGKYDVDAWYAEYVRMAKQLGFPSAINGNIALAVGFGAAPKLTAPYYESDGSISEQLYTDRLYDCKH